MPKAEIISSLLDLSDITFQAALLESQPRIYVVALSKISMFLQALAFALDCMFETINSYMFGRVLNLGLIYEERSSVGIG